MMLTANHGRLNNEKIKSGKRNKSACGKRTKDERIKPVRNRPDRHSRC